MVDHDSDDPALLVAEIHRNLRGWEMADNGEAVMVDLGVHEVSACPGPPPRPPRHGAAETLVVPERWAPVSATDGPSPAGIGSYRSAVRFPLSGRWWPTLCSSGAWRGKRERNAAPGGPETRPAESCSLDLGDDREVEHRLVPLGALVN